MKNDIETERYQMSSMVGFYGLDSISAKKRDTVRVSVRQQLTDLYQNGYRNFAVVSESGFSLLALRELIKMKQIYTDIFIVLFELIDLNTQEWPEEESYAELRREVSMIINTTATKGIGSLPELATKLLTYCQHLVCYAGNNTEALEQLKKFIRLTVVC